jgi:hypothetical protein
LQLSLALLSEIFGNRQVRNSFFKDETNDDCLKNICRVCHGNFLLNRVAKSMFFQFFLPNFFHFIFSVDEIKEWIIDIQINTLKLLGLIMINLPRAQCFAHELKVVDSVVSFVFHKVNFYEISLMRWSLWCLSVSFL